MWFPTVEQVAVPRPKYLDLITNGDFDLAFYDDATFFTNMAQKLLAGVCAGGVGFIENLKCMLRCVANLSKRNSTLT